MIISKSVWVSPIKKKNHTILFIPSGLFDCRLTQLYPGERRACVSMFDIQRHRRDEERKKRKIERMSRPQEKKKNKMLLDQKINRRRRKKKCELTEIFSVLFCSWYCCQTLHIAMVISKNKMWNTVSYWSRPARSWHFFYFCNFTFLHILLS